MRQQRTKSLVKRLTLLWPIIGVVVLTSFVALYANKTSLESSNSLVKASVIDQLNVPTTPGVDAPGVQNKASSDPKLRNEDLDLDEKTPMVRFQHIMLTFGCLLLLFYLFFAVAILCDKYVVPSIELICEGLNIPDEMACASFLAFGEAAPEIMISILATLKGKFSMGMGGILGSAIIAFGLIPSGSAVVAPKGLTLLLFPIVRDTSAFLTALSLLMGATHDEKVTLFESGILLGLFVVYMLLIFAPKIYSMCCKTSKGKPDYDAIPTTAQPDEDGLTCEDDGGEDAEEGDGGEDAPEGCMKCMYYCCLPIYWTFRLTMPDLEDDSKCRHLYPLTFLISMVYIAVLSQAIIEVTEEISLLLGMTTVLASVTFIAMGAQVPDTMSALMLARAGHDDGAISHAISSQVMNIVLGVGIPCSAYNILSGPMPMNLGGLHVAAACVYVLVFIYLLCLFVSRCVTGKIWLGRSGGAVLFIAYVAVTIFVGINECCLKLG